MLPFLTRKHASCIEWIFMMSEIILEMRSTMTTTSTTAAAILAGLAKPPWLCELTNLPTSHTLWRDDRKFTVSVHVSINRLAHYQELFTPRLLFGSVKRKYSSPSSLPLTWNRKWNSPWWPASIYGVSGFRFRCWFPVWDVMSLCRNSGCVYIHVCVCVCMCILLWY